MPNIPHAVTFSDLETLAPVLLVLAALVVVALAVLMFPMLRRGPNSSRYRDPWRGFRYAARSAVMDRAQGRCESAAFIAWGRCADPATEADHIIPWSKGGPTVLSNGQALCTGHNRNKRAMFPPWWYVLRLERRRRAYFPADADTRVYAVLSPTEQAAREEWLARRAKR